MDLQHLDYVEATYDPIIRDDLTLLARESVGERGEFCVGWMVEEGRYEGNWALNPMEFGRFRFGWAPLCDFRDVRLVAATVGGEEWE